MADMFLGAKSFQGNVLKWDVSRVNDMNGMFMGAKSFEGDISKWDVSRVADMHSMSMGATAFNANITEWDVSSVTNMIQMFKSATSFNQQLCGAAWVDSKATKIDTFRGSSGSISRPVCTSFTAAVTTSVMFSPQSKSERKSAVDAVFHFKFFF